MPKRITLSLGAVLLFVCALPVLAADPTSDQIYQALRAGNLASAQQMIAQVLRDNPRSAKAHFVAAEVDARAGNLGPARQELQTAEALKPGLPFASPRSVRELQQQLGEAPLAVTSIQPPVRVVSHSSHLGLFLLLIGGAVVLWLVLRRRARAMGYGQYPGQYGQYPGGVPPGVPPLGYGQGGYPGGYMPGGGPGIMGSVASGLAVGAGVAAGEALVDRMIGGGTNTGGGGFVPPAQAEPPPDPNADMGGNDFGLNDPGSWDDGSGGGGGWDDGGGGGGDDGGGWT
ncbi:MAG TPA: hypothetical protein VGT07_05515 [Steroidobacteraceae bacterium]|nr:hypothetical protein [Steroidobacteraceae bacterium]